MLVIQQGNTSLSLLFCLQAVILLDLLSITYAYIHMKKNYFFIAIRHSLFYDRKDFLRR